MQIYASAFPGYWHENNEVSFEFSCVQQQQPPPALWGIKECQLSSSLARFVRRCVCVRISALPAATESISRNRNFKGWERLEFNILAGIRFGEQTAQNAKALATHDAMCVFNSRSSRTQSLWAEIESHSFANVIKFWHSFLFLF